MRVCNFPANHFGTKRETEGRGLGLSCASFERAHEECTDASSDQALLESTARCRLARKVADSLQNEAETFVHREGILLKEDKRWLPGPITKNFEGF